MLKPSLRLVVGAVALAASALVTPTLPSTGSTNARVLYREVCRLLADPHDRFTYVPPPMPQASSLMSSSHASNITVNYIGAWDPAAQNAFAYAAAIWRHYVSSPVPIVVNANWTAFSNAAVLGSAGSNYVYRDFPGFVAGTWYHAALANKLFGADVNTSQHDINASFNSARSDWYFGTDGFTPAGKFDFVSVVLHELGHGLGFSGSMISSDGATASWGLNGGTGSLPMIYDRFAENAAGTDLIALPSPSSALYAELTSGNIFWNGINGIAAAGTRPKLDAQNPFTQGSNYSHLDENTYSPGNPNSLMTRFLSSAEAIHNPGPITLGILEDEGWSTPCTYSIAPTSAAFTAAGGTGQVSVTTRAGCAWTAASNSAFISITGGASGTGSGTVSYTVAAGPNTPRTGTLTIAGNIFTVAQGPLVALERSALYFGAVISGGTLTSQTPEQTVAVNFSGIANSAWTAAVTSPNSSWVTVTNGSGTGNGRFTVAVANTGGVLPPAGSVTATITITASGVANSPQTLTVTLTLKSAATAAVPTGAFDTPADFTTLSGSVAVTGWALDDIEVSTLEIWRDPHPADPAGAVYGGPPPQGGKVFVGHASFVTGARSDLEAAAPTTPLNYRAGWGYLMLTRGLIWDGQGQFRFYAIAHDRDGHITQIGSKLVTVVNAGSTKPFGTIDTPPSGATVSGIYPNTGWVLTPNSGHTIPASGVQVAVDGVFLSGTLSMSDRADITAGFGSSFNTTGAGRGIFIDTNTYSNGVHIIGWLVTDTAAQADGVGSRFFTIANGSSLTTSSTSSARIALDDASNPSVRYPRVYERESALGVSDADGAVLVQTGMNPHSPLRTVAPGRSGIRSVRIAEMDRVELRVADRHGLAEPHYTAYLVGNGQLRPLPFGSTFDARRGILYWQPAAGYVGTYHFVIVETTRGRAYRVSVAVGSPPVLAAALRQLG